MTGCIAASPLTRALFAGNPALRARMYVYAGGGGGGMPVYMRACTCV